MEHKIYTITISFPSETESNKVQVGTMTSVDEVITAITNSGGQALATGWKVNGPAPSGDLFFPTMESD